MRLIDIDSDEVLAGLAAAMGLPPDDQSSWPVDWMRRLLRDASSRASDYVALRIEQARSPHFAGPAPSSVFTD